MNNLGYSTFIANPPKMTNCDIKPSCPTHGNNHIVTTNDGNKTQKCLLCNWTHHNTPYSTLNTSFSGVNMHCPTHGNNHIVTTNDGNKTQKCLLCDWTHHNTQTRTLNTSF